MINIDEVVQGQDQDLPGQGHVVGKSVEKKEEDADMKEGVIHVQGERGIEKVAKRKEKVQRKKEIKIEAVEKRKKNEKTRKVQADHAHEAEAEADLSLNHHQNLTQDHIQKVQNHLNLIQGINSHK